MKVLLVPGPAILPQIASIEERLRAGGADVELGTADDLTSAGIADIEVVAGPGSLACDAAFFERSHRLRGLVSIGIGCEGFDQAEAARRGIAIKTGATQENVTGMASATVMLMLALAHDLPGAEQASRGGSRRDTGRARSLDDMVVGLIGYGAIGRDVARRLRAWNIDVQAYSPSRSRGQQEDGTRFVALDELLTSSDCISLHAALNAGSRNLLSRDRLARCKPGAVIVNTARGGLIDEQALAEMLAAGSVRGAALDCFAVEPLPHDSPLRSAPNVILTPHQIGHTATGAQSVIDALVTNILSFSDS